MWELINSPERTQSGERGIPAEEVAKQLESKLMGDRIEFKTKAITGLEFLDSEEIPSFLRETPPQLSGAFPSTKHEAK